MQDLIGQHEESGLYPESTKMPLEGFKLEDMF